MHIYCLYMTNMYSQSEILSVKIQNISKCCTYRYIY